MSQRITDLREAFEPASKPMADAGPTGEALKRSIAMAWEIRCRLARAVAGDANLATKLFSESTQSRLARVCEEGSFMAALEAFDSLAGEIGPHWSGLPALGRLLASAQGPRGHGSRAPEDLAKRWEALAASAWWSAPCSEDALDNAMMDSATTDLWKSGLAGMAKLCALRPERSAAAAKVVAQWRFHAWPLIMTPEHFGRELGQALGRSKIAGGALPGPIWDELPFEARLGICLGAHGESKLGQWSVGRLLADLAADSSPEGEQRRRSACAAFWAALELPRIEALEAAFPASSDEWLRPGLLARMGSAQGLLAASSMEWHYAQEEWGAKRADWARRLLANSASKPGDPDFAASFLGRPDPYGQALVDVRTLRQADQIRSSLPKKDKAHSSKARSL